MRPFELIDPRTLQEALDLATRYGKEAQYFASGADVLYMLKDELEGPALPAARVLIQLGGIDELHGMTRTAAGTRIGAMTRLADLIGSAELSKETPLLVEAARTVASPQLRHTSTLGGNLLQRPRCSYFRKKEIVCLKKGGSTCWAVEGDNRYYHAVLEGGPCHIVHPSDLAPALIALGATIEIAGPRGPRAMGLEDFFLTTDRSIYRENALEPGEIVTSVTLPPGRESWRQAFRKITNRQADEFSLVAVAVALRLTGKRIDESRLVLGGVSPRPYLAAAAAAHLAGKEASDPLLAEATARALASATPMSMNGYKVDIARNVLEEVLRDLTRP